MRYNDIDVAFDPLMKNITMDSLDLIGVYAAESRVYISVNGTRRKGIETDLGGKFECSFDSLVVSDVITFEAKVDGVYTEFWQETIRE